MSDCQHTGTIDVVERDSRHGPKVYYRCCECQKLIRAIGAPWPGADQTPTSFRARVRKGEP